MFWDADIWVWPTLNLFHSTLADSHLRFRMNGLAGARAKAEYYKQDGIMYGRNPSFLSVNGGDSQDDLLSITNSIVQIMTTDLC